MPAKKTTLEAAIDYQDTYLAAYQVQWADIHHTRNQDWEFAKLILAGFLGLSGLTAFTSSTTLIILLAGVFVFFSVLGILVTMRHKRLFDEKMDAIRKLEVKLRLDHLDWFPKKRRKQFPLPATQTCLVAIYIASGLVFIVFILVQLNLI
jgi:hypothetical protein